MVHPKIRSDPAPKGRPVQAALGYKGIEPLTDGLKIHCSTIELITRSTLVRRLAGRYVSGEGR